MALEAAAGIAGLVALAELVLNRGYKYYSAVKGAVPEIKDLLVEVNSLYGVLRSLDLLMKQLEGENDDKSTNSTSSSMFERAIGQSEPIIVAEKNLKELEKILSAYDLTSQSKREKLKIMIKWPLDTGETQRITKSLQQIKSTLQLSLQVSELSELLMVLKSQETMQTLLENIKEGQGRINQSLERIEIDQEKTRILNWCSDPDAVNPQQSHSQALKSKHKNTAVWFKDRDEFINWQTEKNGKLWLFGIPGAGKTVMASSIIDHLETQLKDEDALAFHYCDYKTESSQILENIVCALIRQVATQSESAFEKLHKIYFSYQRKKSRIYSLADADIQDLIKIIQELSKCFLNVWIVIDGLDECAEGRASIAKQLDQMCDPDNGNIKIAISSRLENDLGESLKAFESLEIMASRDDILLYVLSTVQGHMDSGELPIRNMDLKATIVSRLVDGSRGMFQWVVCQIRYLCDLSSDAERREALDNLPPELNDTYQRILERSTKHRNKKVPEYLTRILRWIAFSEEPLTIVELSEAISDIITPDNMHNPDSVVDDNKILLWGGSLLRVNGETDYIEFSHFTVKDFLLNETQNLPYPLDQFHLRPDQDNLVLAKFCFRYLLLDDFKNSFLEPVKPWSYGQQFKLLPYVDTHWDDHLRGAANSWDTELVKLTNRFFRRENNPFFYRWRKSVVYHLSWDGQEARVAEVEPFFESEDIQLHVVAAHGLLDPLENIISQGLSVNAVKPPYGTTLGIALANPFFGADLIENQIQNQYQYRHRQGRDTSKSYENMIFELLKYGADPNVLDPDNPSTDCFMRMFLHYKYIPEVGLALFSRLNRPVPDYVLDILLDKINEKWINATEVADLLASSSRQWTDQQKLTLLQRIEEFGGSDAALRLLRYGENHPAVIDQGKPRQETEPGQGVPASSLVGQITHDPEFNGSDPSLENHTFLALLVASRAGIEHNVRDIITKFPGIINSADPDGLTALSSACKMGFPSIASVLLDAGALVNLATSKRWTPLHFASAGGHLDCVKLLLDHGADLNYQSTQGETSLMVLWKQSLHPPRWEDISNAILSQEGFDFHLRSVEEVTYTHFAARLPTVKFVKQLLDQGLDPNAQDTLRQMPLHFAASNSAVSAPDIISDLLERGALVDEMGEQGSPLMIACERGSPESIKVLVSRGADFTAKDSQHRLPQHRAAMSQDARRLEALIEATKALNLDDGEGTESTRSDDIKQSLSFDLNEKCGSFGNTTLHYALGSSASPRTKLELFTMMIKTPGLKVDTPNLKNETPLILAAQNFCKSLTEADKHAQHSKCWINTHILKILLKTSERIAEFDSFSKAALCYILETDHSREYTSCAECWEEVLWEFRQHPDFNFDDKVTAEGCTPLLAYLRHSKTLKFRIFKQILRTLKADIMAVTNTGENCLHLLVWPNYGAFSDDEVEIAEFLIFKGLSIDAADSVGQTPLMKASRSGTIRLINILIKHGADVNKSCDKGRSAIIHSMLSTILDPRIKRSEVVRALLTSNTTVLDTKAINRFQNDQEGDNYSALHMALALGDYVAAEVMLDHETADSNHLTDLQYGVWHAAVDSVDPAKAIAVLSERRLTATINTVGTTSLGKYTPLSFATRKGLGISILDSMIDAGADVTFKSPDQYSCIESLLFKAEDADAATLSWLLTKVPRIKYARDHQANERIIVNLSACLDDFDSGLIYRPDLVEIILQHHDNIDFLALSSLSRAMLPESCFPVIYDFIRNNNIILVQRRKDGRANPTYYPTPGWFLRHAREIAETNSNKEFLQYLDEKLHIRISTEVLPPDEGTSPIQQIERSRTFLSIGPQNSTETLVDAEMDSEAEWFNEIANHILDRDSGAITNVMLSDPKFDACKNKLFYYPEVSGSMQDTEDGLIGHNHNMLHDRSTLQYGRESDTVRDKKGKLTILQLAISHKNQNAIKSLICNGCLLSAKDSNGFNSLAYILHRDDSDLLNLVVEVLQNLDVNAQEEQRVDIFDGMYLPFQQRLPQPGAELDPVVVYGCTPFTFLAYHHAWRCAEILARMGQTLFRLQHVPKNCTILDLPDEAQDLTPKHALRTAVFWGAKELVQRVLELGDQLQPGSYWEHLKIEALIMELGQCAKRGIETNLDILKHLAEQGPKISANLGRYRDYVSRLFKSVPDEEHETLLDILLEAVIEVKACDDKKVYPLQIALYNHKHYLFERILKMLERDEVLLQLNVKLEETELEGRNSLELIGLHGCTQCLEIIEYEIGTDLNGIYDEVLDDGKRAAFRTGQPELLIKFNGYRSRTKANHPPTDGA